MKLRAAFEQLALAFDAPSAAPPPAPAAPSPAPPEAPDVRLRSVALDDGALTFRLRRARRRSIGFQIDDRGLTVSAPRWVTLREIDAAVAEKARWIRSKLADWHAWKARRRIPEIVYAHGAALPVLGGTLTVRLAAGVRATEARDGELLLALPLEADATQVRDTVQSWLQAEARRVFGERLAVLAPRIDARPRGWALSSARSQWGSCTADGRIRLNWRLIHFTPAVIDYVVAHELAHLKEMNHGARFWRVVGEVLPAWEQARAELRQHDIGALL